MCNNLLSFHLDEKLRAEGFYDSYPILKVKCIANGFMADDYAFDSQDLFDVFSKFQKVDRVVLDSTASKAYIFFKSFKSAYLAYKFMDRIYFSRQNIELIVSWLRY